MTTPRSPAAPRPDLYRMPTVFGPSPGPRQAPPGVRYDDTQSPHRVSVYARFHTQANAVQQLLPEGLQALQEALLAIEFSYLSEIDWLAGRGYNMLSVRVPVRRAGDSPMQGWFQPVIWENLTEPILSGREELGWNKIYADLPPMQSRAGEHRCLAQWQGFRFLDLTLDELTPAPLTLGGGLPVLHHKFIPATGNWGQADVDYLTMTPPGSPQMRVLSHVTGRAQAIWHRPHWEDMPTQHHIVQALADLPITGLHSAGMYTSRGGKDLSDQTRLD
ncbi:acetoacetate decarboxylase family protein [Achromobacter sp. GG226]|uniref:acetoacetate decarboxylase family protein n=1 Tax=Verticiella alkaliphila TaxID=2779529 RepID=UPI001C0BE030|nr:acetoacetate decarboxylase family protein [Verticiella sp. GG226]MBU4612410.1 acetoacetate decarboxylase family protein [Verticiella sp. GG226]